MSTGHRRGVVEKPKAELYQILGEADTSALYARSIKLDTSCDIPYAGGNSVDGKTVYIDRKLYREVMDGKVRVRGMSAKQIIEGFIEHEHTEFAVDAGDNPVDMYLGAHGFATAKEHKFVHMLGVDPDRYEREIGPALKRCMARDPENPPKDLWCGPYLDQPDKRDLEILRIFRAKGVLDAFKASKIDANYGIGEHACRDCRYFGEPVIKGDPGIRPCEKVCGLVRANRQCDWWTEQRT